MKSDEEEQMRSRRTLHQTAKITKATTIAKITKSNKILQGHKLKVTRKCK